MTDKDRIAAFLADHGGSTDKNIYGALGIPVADVNTYLNELRAEGVVRCVEEKTKKGTSLRWSLVEQEG